jgi:endogenous inhibitor of DNA gyrase (YacG/DUF329 family)
MADLGRWLQGDYRISDRTEEPSGVSRAANQDEDDEATSAIERSCDPRG